MQENVKISKIASEFSLYLLDSGIDFLDIQIKKEESSVQILFECNKIEKSRLKKLTSQLKKKRNRSFEVYGWELIGQADNDDELGLIGNLIDEYSYQELDGKVIFKLVRYEEI